jgi:hypothetical protein
VQPQGRVILNCDRVAILTREFDTPASPRAGLDAARASAWRSRAVNGRAREHAAVAANARKGGPAGARRAAPSNLSGRAAFLAIYPTNESPLSHLTVPLNRVATPPSG